MDKIETSVSISLNDIISERSLSSYVQSIRDLKSQTTYGHEVLVRGPSDSLWHRPINCLLQLSHSNSAGNWKLSSSRFILKTSPPTLP